MANTSANVRIGKPASTGGVLVGALGASPALPTDATTALASGFNGVGYIGEDGVTMSQGTDVKEIKSWGGDTVRKVQTSHDCTFKFVMIETNQYSAAAYFGDANVTYTAPTPTKGNLVNSKVTGAELDHKKWVFEILDGLAKVRVVVPDGQITERGDVAFKTDEAIGYEVTVTAYPDASAVKAYLYTDDGQHT